MDMVKPKDTDWYDWKAFVIFFKKNYPNIELEVKGEEECWKF